MSDQADLEKESLPRARAEQPFLLNKEWHARPGLRLNKDERFVHIVTSRSARLLVQAGIQESEDFTHPEARYHIFQGNGFAVKWEGHTEASSYSFSAPANEAGTFAKEPFDFLPPLAQQAFMEAALLAARVEILPATSVRELGGFAEAKKLFDGALIYGGLMSDGHAAVWSSYELDRDGFLRILIVDISLTEGRLSRLVQRLLDIETYRYLAIKALPVARATMNHLDDLEPRLEQIIAVLAENTEEVQEDLLHQLTSLAAKAERLVSTTSYRFAAARAYEDIVLRRLAELREDVFEGHQRITVFLNKSFRPAMRTCEASARRASDFTDRINRAVSLLNSLVDMAQKRQNNEIMRSLERQAATQVKLQQAVEGFSIFAISYYAVGLGGYLLKGLKSTGLPVSENLAVAVMVPMALVVSWLTIRVVKNRVAGD